MLCLSTLRNIRHHKICLSRRLMKDVRKLASTLPKSLSKAVLVIDINKSKRSNDLSLIEPKTSDPKIYFDWLKRLLIEEVRIAVKKLSQKPITLVNMIDSTSQRKSDTVSQLIFDSSSQTDRMDVMLLQRGPHKFLSIVQNKSTVEMLDSQFVVKFNPQVLPADCVAAGAEWEGVYLTSITQLERMYNACRLDYLTSDTEELISRLKAGEFGGDRIQWLESTDSHLLTASPTEHGVSSHNGTTAAAASLLKSVPVYENLPPSLVQFVLSCSMAELKANRPVYKLHPIEPFSLSLSAYLERMRGLLPEEARAMVAANLNSPATLEHSFPLTVRSYRVNNKEAPVFQFEGAIDFGRSEGGDSLNVLLLMRNNLQMIAIANYEKVRVTSDNGYGVIKPGLRVVISKEIAQFLSEEDVGENAQWDAVYLGSLLSLHRMYKACDPDSYGKKTLTMLSKVASGSIDKLELSSKERDHGDTLNASQRHAVNTFLELQKGNVMLLQGPPGTGKTSTVAALLYALGQQSSYKYRRTLVCAPSNKAVQVLAEKYLLLYPTASIVLVAKEDRVTQPLVHISLDAVVRELNFKFNELQLIETGWANGSYRTAEEQKTSFQNLLSVIRSGFAEHPVIGRYGLVTAQQVSELDSMLEAVLNEQYPLPSDVIFSDQIPQSVSSYLQAVHGVMSLFTDDSDIFDEMGTQTLLLNSAQVVFATLVSSGNSIMEKMNRVQNLVVDEAGQSVEAETLIPFKHSPSKVLLVGDNKQLPATVNSMAAVRAHLDWSMMRRLVEECGQDSALLDTQYRMHSEICAFPSNQFYFNKLQTVYSPRSVQQHGSRCVFRPRPMVFYNIASSRQNQPHKQHQQKHQMTISPNVHHSEQVDGYFSIFNLKEVQYVVQIVKKIRQHDRVSSIGVITFYEGQRARITTEIRNDNLSENVKVSTVDGFQGDECDIIVISFVRSNRHNSVGFVKDFRRLNVAITRAKHNLIMLGCMKTLGSDEKAEDLRALIADTVQRDCMFSEKDLIDTLWKNGSHTLQQQSEVRRDGTEVTTQRGMKAAIKRHLKTTGHNRYSTSNSASNSTSRNKTNNSNSNSNSNNNSESNSNGRRSNSSNINQQKQ